jgi:hypothetical protein
MSEQAGRAGDKRGDEEPRRVHAGPSWALMLGVIFAAILVALAIAWAFIEPLLHPHHAAMR